MATMDRFETLLSKADAAASQAMPESGNDKPARAMHAQMAGMWLETARLEHQIFVADRLDKRLERFSERLSRLEQMSGVLAPPEPVKLPGWLSDGAEQDDDVPVSGF